MSTHRSTSTTPWGALPVLIAGAFLVVLDFFIVNVALPAIGSDLHASESALEWVVAGYGLAFAAFLVLAGRLGDQLGRRRVYVAGLALFTAASLACGLAPDAGSLIVARVVQGTAGAIVMPQVLSILSVSYRGPAYAKALSVYGLALGLAAVGGQVIGGALVQLDVAGLGWRSCFLVNVPIGVAAIAAAPRLVPDSRAPRRTRLDVAGAGLLAAGLAAVLLPLIEGRQQGWPLWTWVSLVVAADLLLAFVLHQRRLSRRGAAPLLELRLYRQRAFSAGQVAQLLLACAQAAFFVYLALYLQLGRGMDPLDAGLLFTVIAVAYVAASGPAPKLAERHGRVVVASGGAALTAGLLLLAAAVAGDGSLWSLAPGMLLAGLGIGLCFTPLTATVLAGIEPAHAGAASGAMSTTQQVGFALGVAVSGLIFFGEATTDVAHAFELALLQMSVLSAGIVVVARLLPRTGAAPAAGATAAGATVAVAQRADRRSASV